MKADVWDETNGLIFFREHVHGIGDILLNSWLRQTSGIYRPVPMMLSGLIMYLIQETELTWMFLRAFNAFLLLSSLVLIIAGIRMWFGRDWIRDLLLAAALLFSGSALITAGWYANIFDATALFFVSLGLWLVAGRRWVAAGIAIGAAFFCKENAVLIAPVLALLWLEGRLAGKNLIRVIAVAAPFAIAYWSARSVFISFGSEQDIHRFSSDSLAVTMTIWFESFWWQHLKRPEAGWMGVSFSLIGLVGLKKISAVVAALVLIAMSTVVYLGMLDYQSSVLISHHHFVGRLYLLPAALMLFILAGWGRKPFFALLLVPLLLGGAQTYVDHLKFQQTYSAIYSLAARFQTDPLIIHYPEKPLKDEQRGVLIGNYPEAHLRINIYDGSLDKND